MAARVIQLSAAPPITDCNEITRRNGAACAGARMRHGPRAMAQCPCAMAARPACRRAPPRGWREDVRGAL
eukprot:752408-Prymnesium_polylepis.1